MFAGFLHMASNCNHVKLLSFVAYKTILVCQRSDGFNPGRCWKNIFSNGNRNPEVLQKERKCEERMGDRQRHARRRRTQGTWQSLMQQTNPLQTPTQAFTLNFPTSTKCLTICSCILLSIQQVCWFILTRIISDSIRKYEVSICTDGQELE